MRAIRDKIESIAARAGLKSSLWMLGFALCAILLLAFLVRAQDDLADSALSVTISKIGPFDVTERSHITLEDNKTDIVGHAWNYEGQEFLALIRTYGETSWLVAGATSAQPGGRFEIDGMRFPKPDTYDLLIGIFAPGTLHFGEKHEEGEWRGLAKAVSQSVRVQIRIAADHEGKSEADLPPRISIVSIADRETSAKEINAVPATGNVYMETAGIPEGMNIYIALHPPGTTRCYLFGPAAVNLEKGGYDLPVSFKISGSPLQVHFEVIAFASERYPGPDAIDWRTFLISDYPKSPPYEIASDTSTPGIDDLRVGYLEITRIGNANFGEDQVTPPAPSRRRSARVATTAPANPVTVDSGDFAEVAKHERLPEGAQIWILTKRKGSDLYLVQGPLIARGPNEAKGDSVLTWMLPSLVFQPPPRKIRQADRGLSDRDTSDDLKEDQYEVLALVSQASLPGLWMPSSAIPTFAIDAATKPLTVTVNRIHGRREPLAVSITRVSGEDVDTDSKLYVDTTASVELEVTRHPDASAQEVTRQPDQSLYVFVGAHPVGTDLWTFHQAFLTANHFIVPDLSLADPSRMGAGDYQLVGILTDGPMPLNRFKYPDFLNYASAISDVVTVQPGGGPLKSFATDVFSLPASISNWMASAEAGAQSITSRVGKTKDGSGMSWGWIMLVLLLLILALLFIMVLLEWWLGMVSDICNRAASKIERFNARVSNSFCAFSLIDASRLVFGVALFSIVLYVLIKFYYPTYSSAIRTATGLPASESKGLAAWVILLTALVGIFLHLSYIFTDESNKAAEAEAKARNQTQLEKAGAGSNEGGSFASQEKSAQANGPEARRQANVQTGVSTRPGLFSLATRRRQQRSGSPKRFISYAELFNLIFKFLLIPALILWIFQGITYAQYISYKSISTWKTLALSMGFLVAIAISMIETVTFFFIMELVFKPLGQIVIWILMLPLRALFLLFRLLHRVFEKRPRTRAPRNPDRLHPSGGRESNRFPDDPLVDPVAGD